MKRHGFTILELMVVISVIVVIAAITIVGYGRWRYHTTVKAMRADLMSAASAMEQQTNFSSSSASCENPDGCIVNLPDSFKPGGAGVITTRIYKSGKYFCIATYNNKEFIRMSINSIDKEVKEWNECDSFRYRTNE